jgi:short-subunit dehydrogenase
MSAFRPIALITGASSGIGAELAREFAAHGHEVVMVARNETQLSVLADRIGAAGHARPHVLPVDLGRLDAGARIGHELAARGMEPAFVVNNAGFGLLGAAAELDRDEQLAMVDLNVRSLTELSLRWIESLERHRGGLLNVASVAGFFPGPAMAVYYASKAYVLSFTEALSRELEPKGVRVTALCPGPVATAFQQRAGLASNKTPPLLGRSAEKVARDGYAALMAGKRLIVPGTGNKLMALVPRIMPRAVMLKLVHARQKRRPRARTGPQWPKR